MCVKCPTSSKPTLLFAVHNCTIVALASFILDFLTWRYCILMICLLRFFSTELKCYWSNSFISFCWQLGCLEQRWLTSRDCVHQMLGGVSTPKKTINGKVLFNINFNNQTYLYTIVICNSNSPSTSVSSNSPHHVQHVIQYPLGSAPVIILHGADKVNIIFHSGGLCPPADPCILNPLL